MTDRSPGAWSFGVCLTDVPSSQRVKVQVFEARHRFRSPARLDASVPVFPRKRESTRVFCCFCALNPSVCSPSPGPRTSRAWCAPWRPPPWRRRGAAGPICSFRCEQPVPFVSCLLCFLSAAGSGSHCDSFSPLLSPLPPLQAPTRRISSSLIQEKLKNSARSLSLCAGAPSCPLEFRGESEKRGH